LIGLWPRIHGVYPVVAYQGAIMFVIVLQVAAILSFALALKTTES